ncbi:MAG: protease HtpX [Gammaproteobacteria bacterium]
MLRIALFLLTNLAILVVASITLSLIGFDGIMAKNGVDLDLNALLVYCAVFGFTGSLLSLFISKWMAKRAMGVHVIEQPRSQQEQWLVRTVQELADQAGIGMPEVGIFEAPESNAFATGWNRNNALVAVSTGLLSRFREDEARAVLAHEIGHVANGDMITLTLIQGVVNTFVMFFSRIIGHTVDRVVFKTEQGHGPAFYITTIIADIVLGILASMIVMAFSRYREFRADAAGAQLASSGAMIRALERLKAEHEAGAEVHMPDSMRAFGIAGGIGKLFASHPPLDKRIEALRSAM